MNKKRALSILMAAAMAAGTLVTSVPVYADDVEEITWMFWDDLEATEDLISKGYKEVIDRFNEEYDGKYHVTPITTNLEEYDGKLNALIAAGQTPDVYICNLKACHILNSGFNLLLNLLACLKNVSAILDIQ